MYMGWAKRSGPCIATFFDNVTYKEDIHAVRYSNHLLNTGHTVTDTMDVVRTGRKGRHLIILEKYHIYKISRNNLHMPC
jgi:hypothetical protein